MLKGISKMKSSNSGPPHLINPGSIIFAAYGK